MLLFVLGAVTAFVALAGVGHDHLDAEVPMRVPWLVVVNLFPIVAALVVVAFPARVLGRAVGYLADSFLATATYIHPANLPPAQKETGFRPKIFRNR